MDTIHAPLREHDAPTTSRRVGYVLAVGINGMLLWAVHQVGAWGWPAFLTDDFDQVLGILSLSLVVSMAANVLYLVVDRGRTRALADLLTTSVALAASVRVWDVFPLDFAGYAVDWAWLARTLLVVAIVGSFVAIVVDLVKLFAGDAD